MVRAVGAPWEVAVEQAGELPSVAALQLEAAKVVARRTPELNTWQCYAKIAARMAAHKLPSHCRPARSLVTR